MLSGSRHPFLRSRCCPPQIPTSSELGFVPPCLFFFFLFPCRRLCKGFWESCQKKNLETPKRRRESLFTLLCVFKKLQRVKQARRVSLPATLYGDGSVFIVFSSLTPHPSRCSVTHTLHPGGIKQPLFIGGDRRSLTSALRVRTSCPPPGPRSPAHVS